MNNKNILTLIFITFSVLKAEAQVSIGLFSGYQMHLGISAEDAFINKKSTTVDFRSFSKGAIPLGITIKYLVKEKVQLEGNYNYLLNIDEIYERFFISDALLCLISKMFRIKFPF
jgi:hypothetical protein